MLLYLFSLYSNTSEFSPNSVNKWFFFFTPKPLNFHIIVLTGGENGDGDGSD